MGIRFICPSCDSKLNVKSYLAGKRGICPKCDARIRIPLESKIGNQPAELAGDRNRTAKSIAACIAEKPKVKWYVRPADGGEFGPAPGEMIQVWANENRIDHRTNLRRDDWLNWQPAANIFTEFQKDIKLSVSPAAEQNQDGTQTELKSDSSIAVLERPVESVENPNVDPVGFEDESFFEALETNSVGIDRGANFSNLQVENSTLAHHNIRRNDASGNKIKGVILAFLSIVLLGSLVAVVILSQ